MQAPIHEFVTEYINSDSVRFHMPGHKGQNLLGCENRDITEISGADALYEAFGIIGASEANAATLFGTGRTVYSTEGSSQCIRAMLELARRWWQNKDDGGSKCEKRPVIVAARNVHKAFLYAAILLDFDVVWLWHEEEQPSLCSCRITSETVEKVLREQEERVAAVYLTSPDYLGNTADIPALAAVCHAHNTLLLVDNAHGAYLHFLEKPVHPMDLGADICCDSAHKTLPVLTGGAYLHVNQQAPEKLREWAKGAMELFGSTSPSYLILQSLDLCNKYLDGGYKEELKNTCRLLENFRQHLQQKGWQTEETDPLRITIKAPEKITGDELAELLRQNHMECEFSDKDYVVLMVTPKNSVTDFDRLLEVIGENRVCCNAGKEGKKAPAVVWAEQKMSMREAYFSEGETVSVSEAVGRICRMPMATCPPAVPVVVPGEQIDEAAVNCFIYYGIDCVEVVKK